MVRRSVWRSIALRFSFCDWRPFDVGSPMAQGRAERPAPGASGAGAVSDPWTVPALLFREQRSANESRQINRRATSPLTLRRLGHKDRGRRVSVLAHAFSFRRRKWRLVAGANEVLAVSQYIRATANAAQVCRFRAARARSRADR